MACYSRSSFMRLRLNKVHDGFHQVFPIIFLLTKVSSSVKQVSLGLTPWLCLGIFMLLDLNYTNSPCIIHLVPMSYITVCCQMWSVIHQELMPELSAE